ncbi:hypothetical protein EDC30_1132 [Paucimonas lemoignei]|uniref:Pectate lyase superfamily protein domain-containing protein n=1 Tax=Paucimonas lemoignei TaxID=29443 RepID=A0A4R3HQM9_PAULE|nr:hypothetical protein [Paucimonas lemoignei]TCS34309.1 hypothetical protein EDC30_1132 [Paucimonas lemoignei]
MSPAPQPAIDFRRRKLLLGGLTASVAGLLQLGCRGSKPELAEAIPAKDLGGNGGAAVPAHRVSLADFGGVPGASPSVLRQSFSKAFAALMQKGGGTLVVPPGLYDFGSYSESEYIVLARGLRDIAISAYGATFKANTTAKVMPHLFYFVDFHNLTIAGARFTDPGFTPWVDWKGMYCVGIQADNPSKGFRLVDCRAENVLGLFSTNNNAATRKLISDLDIQGEICGAYYGVGASYVREQVQVKLTCHNVRRAFIAYALKNADIDVTVSSTENWPGSNGLIALVCGGAGAGNVENVKVRVKASGAGIYSGYVHFYHQGPEAAGSMRNIDATINVVNVSDKPNLFLFDHETSRVQEKTTRVWENIALRGSISGRFAGRIISNPSVSTSPGSVYVDPKLAELADMSALPRYFGKKAVAVDAADLKSKDG